MLDTASSEPHIRQLDLFKSLNRNEISYIKCERIFRNNQASSIRKSEGYIISLLRPEDVEAYIEREKRLVSTKISCTVFVWGDFVG